MNLEITKATAQGPRPYQEDRFVAEYVLDGYLLVVADGHGGSSVASIVEKEISELWASDALERPIARIQNVFSALNGKTRHSEAGSTLSLAWLPDNDDVVYVAVLGDSPVIVKDATGKVHLSVEHNVRSNPKEAQTVIERGGFVSGGYAFERYNGPGLQMSRALGDQEIESILNREPEITSFHLGPGSYVLVGSDGCFDPGHASNDGIKAVLEIIDAGGDAQAIVDRAVREKIYDNATAVLARVQ